MPASFSLYSSLGPDGTGYAVDVLRSAGSPHRLPVGMYLIANDATTLPLRTYSALMHGAKCLNFYCYGPYYAFVDGTLSENVPAQRALAAVTREIAKADHLLAPGHVPSAQVAVSYFKSHEIWQTDGAIQVERRNTYLALTHDNYPVDFLDEPLVEQGALGRYQVLHLVDSNVSRDAAVKIRDWVAQGGTLVACAGAGLRDPLVDGDDPLERPCAIGGIDQAGATALEIRRWRYRGDAALGGDGHVAAAVKQ